jgi:hypothetical protein
MKSIYLVEAKMAVKEKYVYVFYILEKKPK